MINAKKSAQLVLTTGAGLATTVLTVAAQTEPVAVPIDSGTAGTIGTSVMILSCISLIIWIAMVTWVYSDAKKKNVDKAWLWALITFFLPLVGILLYLLIGRKKSAGAPAETAPTTETPPATPAA